jgi:PHD/YefM family antitoxin component YafN of YafNO toxin-antitoxin module
MSVEEYESLLETLEILADLPVTRALRRAGRNFAKGRTLRHQEVWPRE